MSFILKNLSAPAAYKSPPAPGLSVSRTASCDHTTLRRSAEPHGTVSEAHVLFSGCLQKNTDQQNMTTHRFYRTSSSQIFRSLFTCKGWRRLHPEPEQSELWAIPLRLSSPCSTGRPHVSWPHVSQSPRVPPCTAPQRPPNITSLYQDTRTRGVY